MICSLCYKLSFALFFLLVSIVVPGAVLADDDVPAGATKLSIVATTGMVADVARHVAGDRAEVVSIMGEGVDPHLYKPKTSDVRRILAADVVFYNGLKLEGRMGEVFTRARSRGRPVHAVTAGLPTAVLLEDESAVGHPDPHVWMDVKTWALTLEEVARVLCEIDPSSCSTYQANAAKALDSMLQLHESVTLMIASIPENQRVLVTAHDAFRYFGRAYDMEVRGIQGISTESEAGLSDLNGLVEFLVERRIPAVFVESSVPRKNVQALIEGAKARGHDVVVGGELFSDAMGRPGTQEGTYEGMIEHNARTMTEALGGRTIQVGDETAVGLSSDENPVGP
ncbi:MAG: zinc ABC transporter substrate-binding protein [Planctomycetota bacterium]|nr:zinc ABC transporter substrate-binding protein [Planctomycetota bacterium]